jgi:serine/threonine-protein kinase
MRAPTAAQCHFHPPPTGEDTELDRNVAIKILHDRFAQDGEFVQRFQREAQSAAGLQHPNVVGIFDRGSFGDTYFIAMEYVDGPSLKDLVKGGMSTKDAIDFTRQILKAARFAHRKGIIHRDLKPQNIMTVGSGPRVKLVDFGIAHSQERSRLTTAGLGVHGVWVNGERIADADGIVPHAPRAGRVLREFAP